MLRHIDTSLKILFVGALLTSLSVSAEEPSTTNPYMQTNNATELSAEIKAEEIKVEEKDFDKYLSLYELELEKLEDGEEYTNMVPVNSEPINETLAYNSDESIENMSLSVLKAQKFGIPCVVSDTGGLPEIVIDGITGSVVPGGDRSAAVEAILRLLEDGALRKMQGESAQEIYAERHDPGIWEETILEIHERRM